MKELRCIKCNSKICEFSGSGDFEIMAKCRKCDCKTKNKFIIRDGKLRIKVIYEKGGENI